MTIYVKHNNEVKSAVPYVKHNGEIKIPTSGWAKTGGELKQIWPPSDTVLISNQATLEAFRDRVNAGETSLNAIITTDFTLTGEWTPIANYASDTSLQYTGTFDGGGHTITGLTINSSISYQGLFGYMGPGGTVKNVKLASSSISVLNYVGGIVGYNGGTVQNCTNSGSVSGDRPVGGIVGFNDGGTVENCTNSATVSGSTHVGGIVGHNNAGTISGNTNAGDVTSTGALGQPDNAGGIVGYNDGGTVSGNTNTGTVTGANITTLA